jgi:hypothetical protein
MMKECTKRQEWKYPQLRRRPPGQQLGPSLQRRTRERLHIRAAAVLEVAKVMPVAQEEDTV